MDAVIQVLAPEVIDQIAAGEVIERPASVVKELVDNAIDAGANTVAIDVGGGGRALIRICDDGCGMTPDDARRALAPHATSKLRVVDDLWTLTTLGFRGEALPSIASVSRLVLTTRRQEDLAATRLEVVGGRVVAAEEVGAPAGTTVEVTELLGNVPARLKFLRGAPTEASHVTEQVARLAMVHPRLHVRLRHDGRTALELPPDRDGLARASALLGPRVGAGLVRAIGEESGVRVTAYLASPEHALTTGKGVQLFVGRRPVRDRGLLHAICMGYGELVPRGRYPVAVVMVDCAAGTVDVNVHPQKHEVRFADAGAVCAAVRHVVQAAVARAPWRADAAGGAVRHLNVAAIAGVTPPALPLDGAATPLAERYASQLREARQLGFTDTERDSPARVWVRDIKDRVRAARVAERVETARGYAPAPSLDLQEPVVRAAPAYFARLRYLGQLDLTYLVCEGDGELVLLDQHAAHERVELARRFAARARRGGAAEVAVQKLLFPVTFDATAPELARVAQDVGVLSQLGFELEVFGKHTLAIKAAPSDDPARVLRALLARWDRDRPSESELMIAALSELACHAAVRAGDKLGASEAEALLAGLDDAFAAGGPEPASSGRCAAGRPMLLRLPVSELARRFGR